MKKFFTNYLTWKLAFLPILATAPEAELSARILPKSQLEIEACIQEQSKQEILELLAKGDYVPVNYTVPTVKKVEEEKIDLKKLALHLRDFEYDPNKNVSSKGARGPYQFMPATWRQVTQEVYGKILPHSKADCPNISGIVAVEYLKDLDSLFKAKVRGYEELPKDKKISLIVAGWNYGPNATLSRYSRKQHMPKETRELAKLVLDAYNTDLD